jgi:hypothetical protein
MSLKKKKSYNHNHLKEARCPECGCDQQLVVWYKDDGWDGCLHTLRCVRCPPPTLCPWWLKSQYNPDRHDMKLGLKDYEVDWSYAFRGPGAFWGLCFACRQRCDLSLGYGHTYPPRELCQEGESNGIAFCQPCYRARQKNHEKFVMSRELQRQLAEYKQQPFYRPL